MRQPFDPTTFKTDDKVDVKRFVEHFNRQMDRLKAILRGFTTFDVMGVVTDVNPAMVDVSVVSLTGDATITLPIGQVRYGSHGDIEFQQDATGGRTVTFVNLLNSAPAVTATANKRTLVRLTFVGDGWVATLIASNY